MDAGLSHLLKSISIQKPYNHAEVVNIDDPFVITTMYGPKSIWKVGSDKLSTFFSEYSQIVWDNNQGNYCVSEIPSKKCPIILHGTLRFSRNKNDLFDTFIRHVIHSVQTTMIEHLQLSENEIELLCIVTHVDDLILINGEYVWDFCLYFPYCVVDVKYQIDKFRHLIIDKFRANNVFSSLSQQPINDWSNRDHGILSDIPNKPVPMYLSRDKPHTSVMKYRTIYKYIPDDCIYEETDLDITCPLNDSSFLPSNHSYIQKGLIDRELLDEFRYESDDTVDNEDCIFWLPLILSVHFWDRVTLPKVDDNALELLQMVQNENEDPYHKQAKMFLDMIDPNRRHKQYYWKDIGKALYSVFYGSEEGLTMWKHFSGEMLHDNCDRLYPTFNSKNYITIKTLAWYAREDSPKEYNAWHYEWCQPALRDATSCLESDVAEAFGRIYWLEFTCSSVKNSKMYYYNHNGWCFSEGGVSVSKLISRDFVKKFETYRTQISSFVENIDNNDSLKLSNEILIKKISLLVTKLKKSAFKSNVLKEIKEWFYDDMFKRVADENPAYVRTINGVIECCENEAVFRPGKPEDYLTKFNEIEYPTHYHWGHPVVLKVKKWIRQVFRDKELENHFFKDAASFLYGKNSEKFFRVWSGDNGNNSKSMIVKLFEAALGVYVIKLPNSVFSGTSSGGGPSPEIARAQGAHGAICQEPDDDEDFKGGKIKGFTGGDSFFARFNHDDGGEVTAMFKLVLMCNKIPIIPSGGQAVRNRLQVFPFLSTWREDAPESEEEQMRLGIFKLDPYFEDSIPELARGFLWIMVQTYKDYKREGLMKVPKLVEKYTQKYWEENDIYDLFSKDLLVYAYKDPEKQHIDENATIMHSDLYREFKVWHKDNFPSAKLPFSPVVKAEMIKRLGQQKNRRWHGVKFVESTSAVLPN